MSLITPDVYREHDPGCTLGDDALQRIIDANEAEMVRKLGPHSRVGSPAVEVHRGGKTGIRPYQAIGVLVSVETTSNAEDWITLTTEDWLLLDEGWTLRRLPGRWSPLVRVTYIPMHNLEERILALLAMVGLDVSPGVGSGGLVSRTMGSWSETYGPSGQTNPITKNAILRSLHPMGGIVLR